MSQKLNQELLNIFKILSANKNINFFENGQVKIGNQVGELLNISDQAINSPINDLEKTLYSKTSPLTNQIPDYDLLTKLLGELNNLDAIRDLNHLGFCYHVESQAKEKSRLLSEKLPSTMNFYEEPSNESAKWYFLGNIADLSSPMIEFLPVESNNDTFIDYWMPNVHIDIDTNLDENQIESLLYKVYDGDPKPFRSTVIEDVVYVIRTRMGIVDGINLFLDLATKHRGVEYHRKNVLKKLT